MIATGGLVPRLTAIPNVTVREGEPLAAHTRFGIGGPAAVYLEAGDEESFQAALTAVQSGGGRWTVIGGGTNLIVSEAGFAGVVLRYRGARIRLDAGGRLVRCGAGAGLQDLVDFSIERGLAGLHTMTGVPGSVGGAVYGNAGAYGRSIAESLEWARLFDGAAVKHIDNIQCEFRYRESVFKRRKDWIVLEAGFRFEPGAREELGRVAAGIREIRDRKYPPTMRCAGSIFKNLILADLSAGVQSQVPAEVVREGKVPSAWFLERVGAKGMREGGIEVADYHANLIYNAGGGTSGELVKVIRELKRRVMETFGLALEEEVQYVGFEGETAS